MSGTPTAPPLPGAPRRCFVNNNNVIQGIVPADVDTAPAGQTIVFGTGAVGAAIVPHLTVDVPASVMGMQHFSIRNGRVEDACDLLVQSSIPATYHWPIIQGVTPGTAIAAVEMFIRAAMVQWDSFPPNENTPELRRKLCIILGASRAAMTAYYELTPGDLVPGETGATMMRMIPPTGAGRPHSFVLDASMTAGQRDVLSAALNLTPDETNVINTLVRCGVGALALQGYSLVMTGHHYLSDVGTVSYKAFVAFEKQLWLGQSVAPFFQANTDKIRDAAWHKAGHPVLMRLKTEWAGKQETKVMLERAQLGSAAARIPAEEPEMRAAGSVLSLMSTLKPVVEGYGGAIDSEPLERMVEEVRAASTVVPAGNARMMHSPRMLKVRELKTLMDAGKGTAAWCFGFYSRMMERDSADAGREVKDSLSASYYLRKLASDSMGAYQAGKAQHQNYEAALHKARKQGIFKAPMLIYGEAPDLTAEYRAEAAAGRRA